MQVYKGSVILDFENVSHAEVMMDGRLKVITNIACAFVPVAEKEKFIKDYTFYCERKQNGGYINFKED